MEGVQGIVRVPIAGTAMGQDRGVAGFPLVAYVGLGGR
jgi:hypothetical protein